MEEKETGHGIPFEILPTDKHFYDSPDTGHRTCLCSRCGKLIPESQMAIRAWPSEPGDQGYDSAAPGGTEFRYHPSCLGFKGLDDNDDYWDEPIINQ